MAQLSNAQRAHLRSLANELKPLVQVGKQGVTEGAIRSVDNALEAHELIKVKFLDWQDLKEVLVDDLVRATRSQLLALIGNTAILYRRQPDPDKRRIDLPA